MRISKYLIINIIILSLFTVLGLVSCSSSKKSEPPVTKPKPLVKAPNIVLPNRLLSVDSQQVVNDFYYAKTIENSIKINDDLLVNQYLFSAKEDNARAESIRKDWLKKLANRGEWALFFDEYAKLSEQAKDQDLACYAELGNIAQGRSSLVKELSTSTKHLSYGCNKLMIAAVRLNMVDKEIAWQRVLIMIANNQISQARDLAANLGEPLPATLGRKSDYPYANQISLLSTIITPKGRNNKNAEVYLASIQTELLPKFKAFGHGIIAYSKARDLEGFTALRHFDQADKQWLNFDQWEWYARSALRISDWQKLNQIIEQMPTQLSDTNIWQYWQARALKHLSRSKEAKVLMEKVSLSGRNFYAVLAHEELGKKLSVSNNSPVFSSSDIAKVEQDGAIQRALILFNHSLLSSDWDMRRAAQRQWLYAIRDYNEDTLLAAAHLAHQNKFYEMAINTADKTDNKLNFELRFPAPFKQQTQHYANTHGVDSAWVYGLIRQESRFMMGAKSRVGASGLMQIMPATARLIARKIGIESYDINDIETNINMGTWYLADIRNNLGSEVLATAGYNAGPGRAKKWQANRPLEAAIYIETIPFNETRDYVKKVMSNTTYYSHLFGHKNQKLTDRIGTIPAK